MKAGLSNYLMPSEVHENPASIETSKKENLRNRMYPIAIKASKPYCRTNLSNWFHSSKQAYLKLYQNIHFPIEDTMVLRLSSQLFHFDLKLKQHIHFYTYYR